MALMSYLIVGVIQKNLKKKKVFVRKFLFPTKLLRVKVTLSPNSTFKRKQVFLRKIFTKREYKFYFITKGQKFGKTSDFF